MAVMTPEETKEAERKFFADMTPEEARRWMVENAVGIFMGQIRATMKETGITREEIAKNLDIPEEQLGRLLRGLEDTVSLDALMQIAHAANRHLEINAVSRIPSEDKVLPDTAPAGLWPAPFLATAKTPEFTASVPEVKMLRVEVGAIPDLAPLEFRSSYQARVSDRVVNNRVEVKLDIFTSIVERGSNPPIPLFDISVGILLRYELPDIEMTRELGDRIQVHALMHATPLYRDTVYVSARRTLPLYCIYELQKHLSRNEWET